MPKCRGKKEWTKHVNNTGRRSRAYQLQAARKASVEADDLGTVTGDLLIGIGHCCACNLAPSPSLPLVSVIGTALLTVDCLNVSTLSSKQKTDMRSAASSAFSGDSDEFDYWTIRHPTIFF